MVINNYLRLHSTPEKVQQKVVTGLINVHTMAEEDG
jgi:hypothetical protein